MWNDWVEIFLFASFDDFTFGADQKWEQRMTLALLERKNLVVGTMARKRVSLVNATSSCIVLGVIKTKMLSIRYWIITSNCV